MSVDFSDERISAYLDGELTPPERAEIESLLATSAAHRQLVDELRMLRVSLQELPNPTLSAGFTEWVLKRALESVTDAATDHGAAAAAHGPAGEFESGAEGNGRGTPAHGIGANPFGAGGSGAGPLGEISLQQAVELRRWRRAFWSVSAVAAGLLGILVVSNVDSFGPLAFHGVATNSEVTAKHLAPSAAAIPSSEAFVSSDLVDSTGSVDFPVAAMDAGGMGAPGGPPLDESRHLRMSPAPAARIAAEAVAGDGEPARKELSETEVTGRESSGAGAFGAKAFRKEVVAEKASALAADAGPGSRDAKPGVAKANEESQRKRAAALRDQARGRGGAQVDQFGGAGSRSDPSPKSASAPLAGVAPPSAVPAGGGLGGEPTAPGTLRNQPKGGEEPPLAKVLKDVARSPVTAPPAQASPPAPAKPAEAVSGGASNAAASPRDSGNRDAVTTSPTSNATGSTTYVLRVVLREDQTLEKAVDRFVRHDTAKLKQSPQEPGADRGDALAEPKPDAQRQSLVSAESSVLQLRASRKQVRNILNEAAKEGLAGQLFAIPSLQGLAMESQRNGTADKNLEPNPKPQAAGEAGTVPGVPAPQGAEGQRGVLRENLDALPLPIAVNGEPIEKSLNGLVLSRRRAGVPPESANGALKQEVQRAEGTTSRKKTDDDARELKDVPETALKQEAVEDAEIVDLIVVLELARPAPAAARPASKENVDSKGDASETQEKPTEKEPPGPGDESDASVKPKPGDGG